MSPRIFGFALPSLLLAGALASAVLSFRDEMNQIEHAKTHLDGIVNSEITKQINEAKAEISRTEPGSLEQGHAYLVFASWNGLYAKKNISGTHLKQSYEAILKAIRIAPNDPDIVLTYSQAVLAMSNEGFFGRNFIEGNIGTSLKECRSNAISQLRAMDVPPQAREIQNMIRALEAKDKE